MDRQKEYYVLEAGGNRASLGGAEIYGDELGRCQMES